MPLLVFWLVHNIAYHERRAVVLQGLEAGGLARDDGADPGQSVDLCPWTGACGVLKAWHKRVSPCVRDWGGSGSGKDGKKKGHAAIQQQRSLTSRSRRRPVLGRIGQLVVTLCPLFPQPIRRAATPAHCFIARVFAAAVDDPTVVDEDGAGGAFEASQPDVR